MTGVPPSVDFTPSWLKFSNTKKTNTYPFQDSKNKHSISPYKSSSKFPSGIETEPGPLYKNFDSHFNGKHKSWHFQGGLEENVEKCNYPTTSQNLIFSTGGRNRTFASNGGHLKKNSQMDVDFPTLVATNSRIKCSNHVIQENSMWKKPLILKSSDNLQSSHLIKQTNVTKSHDTPSIYKSLVPKSSPTCSKQQSYRRIVDKPSATTLNKSKTTDTKKFNNAKTKMTVSQLQAPQILDNTRITHPLSDDIQVTPAIKRHRKGKSVFLKELRHSDDPLSEFSSIETSSSSDCATPVKKCPFKENLDDSPTKKNEDPSKSANVCSIDSTTDSHDSMTQDIVKDWWEEVNTDLYDAAPDDDTLPLDNPPLSSSLEAEYRLLRQMGWNDCREGADGDAFGCDESPLTEAEIREFFLNNKKKGLIGVPSPSHRETAFRDALRSWILSGPPVMRRSVQSNPKLKQRLNDTSSTCSVSSDFSRPSSSDIESD